MRSVVTVCLLIPINVAFGLKNVTNIREVDNETMIAENFRKDASETTAVKSESFLDDVMNWGPFLLESDKEKSKISQADENERKLKYKKGEIQFVTKILLIFKIVLVLFLPLGIIASKILSWKAVTLSLMAFMLAKILFIKNLLSGKNAISVTPTNLVPPYFIHGGANDLFWKRQGEANAFAWTQTQP